MTTSQIRTAAPGYMRDMLELLDSKKKQEK